MHLIGVDQGWAIYGPRAACGPPEYIMRPVGPCVEVNFVRLKFSLYFKILFRVFDSNLGILNMFLWLQNRLVINRSHPYWVCQYGVLIVRNCVNIPIRNCSSAFPLNRKWFLFTSWKVKFRFRNLKANKRWVNHECCQEKKGWGWMSCF